jgi:hypothetical protein
VPRCLVTLLLLLLALTGLAPGCGGEDEGSPSTTTAPELTVPGEEGETETTETQSTTPTAPPGSGGGGGGTQSPPRTQPDSPQNDIPPEPGTPEDRFERFCRENPGACG